MPFFRLSVLCDGSLNGPAGVAGIGVVIKLVNSHNITDEHPLLFAWPGNLPFLFASVLSNHVILRRRIREICGPGNLLSATILNDCKGAVNGVQTNIRNGGVLAELVKDFKDYYGKDLDIVWEGNRNHAQQHPLALVDWMANQARLQLPKVGQTVYARDGNGLDDWLRHRRAEAEAAARAHALEAPW